MRFKVGDKVLVEGRIIQVDETELPFRVEVAGKVAAWMESDKVLPLTPAKTPRWSVSKRSDADCSWWSVTDHSIGVDCPTEALADKICKLLNDAEPKPRVVRIGLWKDGDGNFLSCVIDNPGQEKNFRGSTFHDIEVPA